MTPASTSALTFPVRLPALPPRSLHTHRLTRRTRPSIFDSLRRASLSSRRALPQAAAQVLGRGSSNRELGGCESASSLDAVSTESIVASLAGGAMLREARRREAKVALVSDTPEGLGALEQMMRADGYSRLRTATTRREAVELSCSWRPDIVIVEAARARRGGLEMLRDIVRTEQDGLMLPVVMLSSDSCAQLRLRALRLGARDFVVQPALDAEIHLRVRNLLDARWGQLEFGERCAWLEEKLREKTLQVERAQSDLQGAQAEVIVRLALAAELHDTETGQHTRRVGLSASLLAQSVGLPEREVEMIQLAAPLHDIGKIAIPDSLLLKPGRLSGDEWEEMKTHCRIGAQVLASGQADLMHVAQRIALFHHEKWDGSGYPMGLREEQIPIEARILAVSDVFDALTHERPYKGAWPIDRALGEIESQSARHFDPRIVAAFRDLPHESLM